MTLSVHLLMYFYQGVSLNWHLNVDVFVIGGSGSYCAWRVFMSITSRYTAFSTFNGLSVKRRRRRKKLATERLTLLRPDVPNLIKSIDFVMEALVSGRRIKCLTCVMISRRSV